MLQFSVHLNAKGHPQAFNISLAEERQQLPALADLGPLRVGALPPASNMSGGGKKGWPDGGGNIIGGKGYDSEKNKGSGKSTMWGQQNMPFQQHVLQHQQNVIQQQ